MILEQIFRLIFKVFEVGIGWKRSYRHNELPFVCPGPHVEGRKSVRETNCDRPGGLLSSPRTGCALLRSADLITTRATHTAEGPRPKGNLSSGRNAPCRATASRRTSTTR
jgi:hypothetical protein